MGRTLDDLEKTILYLTVFLVPIFILPIFANPYDTAKIALLAAGVSAIIIIRSIKIFITGKAEYYTSNFDIPILIFALAYLLSGILITPNKVEAFFLPGTALVVILGSILYFLSNMVMKENKRGLKIAMLTGGVTLSVLTLLSASRVLSKISFLPDFMKATTFSFTGGELPTAIFLSIIIPLAIGMIMTEAGLVKKLFWAVSFLILALGLGVSIYFLLPGQASALILPSYQTSWATAMESLKQSPLLGVGPANFLSAFGQFRPLSYNATPFWSLRFSFATNFFLTLLAEVGLVGLAGYILLFVASARVIKDHLTDNLARIPWAYISLALVLLLTLLVPANLVFLMTFFLILSICSVAWPSVLTVSPSFDLPIPLIAGIIVFWFFGARVLVAEARFQDGLNALNKNDAKATYASLTSAVNLDPYADRYHATLAQIDMAVARSIAQKKNLTDTDRNNIAQAIQSAIAEGKATVALNPQRSAGWALLGGIYQAVMPFAQGSDSFAIQSYSQAIALEPIDPNLRITLGGVYYALGRYDDAITSFQLATYAKPDLANAHYNLSAAYREKGDVDKAISEMQIVLTLVPKNSNDYTTAQKELSDLQKKKTEAQPQGTQNLTVPTKAAAPAITPQITLPSEATPPATP